MSKHQISMRIGAPGEKDQSVNRPGGHDISPRFARLNEVQLAVLAGHEALRALHGTHIAVAAGATAAAEQVQPQTTPYLEYIGADRRPEFVPASQEVQTYAATQPGFVPQSPEVQAYAATQAAPQPVQASVPLGAQVQGP
ncbi:MAG TPA: hypothetical protein VLF71_00140 [Candidatus Saccharimonadales bacterium]|nr:hypothetical protein [Candidatus Saccharimonadales bacterium]